MLKIQKTIKTILLWPSLDGDEGKIMTWFPKYILHPTTEVWWLQFFNYASVSKAQHGCIDCLALMICTELQAPKSFNVSDKISSIRKNFHPGWYPDLIGAFVFLTGGSHDFCGSKC